MKKFLLQIILLSVLDFGTFGLIGEAPLIYVLLWLLVWVVFRVRGSDLFVQGLLLSGLIYILVSEPYGNLPSLALWYIPLVVFLFFVRKQEKEDFCPLFCLVAPFWMGIACAVTACAGWTTDCLNGANVTLGMCFLLITLCQAVCAGFLNWIWKKIFSS
ncbi:MAG: hypothetical protein K2J71_00185 [Oscillospiraceae bacterium]|nr:hypothetical protein [Oscillospiraceae bacterium]